MLTAEKESLGNDSRVAPECLKLNFLKIPEAFLYVAPSSSQEEGVALVLKSFIQ